MPPPVVRERWHELHQLRQTDGLDGNQQAEITKLYDQIEANRARRIEAAAELAKLWQVSLNTVIDQLGLRPANDDD